MLLPLLIILLQFAPYMFRIKLVYLIPIPFGFLLNFDPDPLLKSLLLLFLLKLLSKSVDIFENILLPLFFIKLLLLLWLTPS